MPSSALQYKVNSMQNEANLLDEHALVLSHLGIELSSFASELSSFAGTFSLQSTAYYAQSDELNRRAGSLMAGGPALDIDPASEDYDDVAVARLARQVARATETMDVRSTTKRTLYSLRKMLNDQAPEVKSEEQEIALTNCQRALKDPLNNRHGFAAVCGMAFVMGEVHRAESNLLASQEDVEVADAIVEDYSRHEDATEDAVAAFAESKKHFRSLVAKSSSKKEKTSKEQQTRSRNSKKRDLGEEDDKDDEDDATPPRKRRPITEESMRPPPLLERAVGSTRAEAQASNTLDWRLWSDLQEYARELEDQPMNEVVDFDCESERDSDTRDDASSASTGSKLHFLETPENVSSPSDRDWGDPDLPTFKVSQHPLEPMQDEDDPVEDFLRNPYKMATPAGTDSVQFSTPLPRNLILAAAERVVNFEQYALGKLQNCTVPLFHSD